MKMATVTTFGDVAGLNITRVTFGLRRQGLYETLLRVRDVEEDTALPAPFVYARDVVAIITH